MTADFRLDGKVALVTGATGNIGADFSRALAAAGADVVLVSRTESALAALAEEIGEAGGGRAAYVPCDVADREQAAGLAGRAWPLFGKVDVVLHNAIPTTPGDSDLLTTPEAGWAQAFDVIVWGCLEVCKGLAPRMIDAGGGSIITVISSTGVTPTPGYAAYGMAKGTLALLTRYMAKEWGPGGIRANSLNPGSIARPGREADMQSRVEQLGIADRISMQRVGRQHEVLGTAVYLASDASSYVSGQVFNIDGGRF